jgi:uncharacterized protein (TIGR00297 family)
MRNGKQVVTVGLATVLSLIIYYFTKIEFFYALFFLTLTEQFADSMASDIGRLTKGRNIDIITFKPKDKGISGGISILGTICALVSSFILMLIPLLFKVIDWRYYLIISSIAFFGTLVDSLLGALFQALYECEVCGVNTESSLHCSQKTKLIKGAAVIDNCAVNLLTGIVTCFIGCLMLLV